MSTREEMRKLGEDFILQFISFVRGEKDPRCLMIIFSLLRVLSVEWTIEQNEVAEVYSIAWRMMSWSRLIFCAGTLGLLFPVLPNHVQATP
jgi:Dos2-interacting transcription regulator of RNA-Pol-II